MKINKSYPIALGALLVAGACALTSCPGATSESGSTGGGGGGTDIDTIVNDVEMEDGEVIFAGEEIYVWTIVGDPDLAGQKLLFEEFNREYRGEITLSYRNVGHYDFYNTLEDTWANDPESFPDLIIMHNEKTAQYAHQGMIRQIDSVLENPEWSSYYDYDFSQVYENIDRSQFYNGHRYGIPMDAHGFLTHFRQDIIKKNNLGFDNNTRFIPESRAEYQQLLEALRQKADSSEGLLVRNLNKGQNHAWRKVDASVFLPEFNQSTDPDGLGAIYANGGRLASDDGLTIEFHQNQGFQTYLTDLVARWNNRLMGEPGTNTEAFSQGNTVMFSEGPWWTYGQYDNDMNNDELKTANSALGVSEEDASDPIYSNPMVAVNSAGFWTLDENLASENGQKWYANGHAFSISSRVTSLTKIYACLEFINWYTQGQEEDGSYRLAEWCRYGHMPAYKNVYESQGYQDLMAENLTVRGLGSPEDVISMEPLPYQVTIFDCVANCVNNVIMGLKGGTITDTAGALQAMNETVTSAQTMLDLMSSGIF